LHIVKPVFIIGPGRSGTTLLLRLMSLHPDLGWFSNWTNRFPKWPQLSIISRLNDVEVLERVTRGRRKWPRPAEAYRIWNYCFTGFSEAASDWCGESINEEGVTRLTHLVKVHLKCHGKKRFLTKYIGWPRISFFKSIFPDVQFVYIDRDPRAVVFSYMKQKWWFKDRQDFLETMSTKERLEFYAGKYLAYHQAKQRFSVSQDYTQAYYEQLIENPLGVLRKLCERTALTFCYEFERRVATWSIIKGTDQLWKQTLSLTEQRYLTTLLEDPLEAMGYGT
jgi:hypothetical protein